MFHIHQKQSVYFISKYDNGIPLHNHQANPLYYVQLGISLPGQSMSPMEKLM